MKPFAGAWDAWSLLFFSTAILFVLPWFDGLNIVFIAPLAVIGAAGIVWPRVKGHLNTVNETDREGFVMPSDETEKPCMGEGGLRLGYTKDNYEPLDIPNSLMSRHTAIVGQSGVGKTTLIEYLLWQQTVRGGGWLFIDAKIDRDTRDHLAYMARCNGRSNDLYILDISSPDESHTMNPLLSGDPDEVASRLMNLIPSSENNPGSDFYRQSANHALTVIVAALQKANKLYHFGDLSILMQSTKALEELERITPPSAERRSLSVFLDQFRTQKKEGVELDMNRLKQVLGGMAGRIALFAQGKFGEVFNVYAPEIVLESIILENKMLYVSLPTMGKDTAALNLGKMVISDLRSAVARIQDLPKTQRPKYPFLAVLDEMGAYVMEGVARLFEQARSAGVALVPAFQSFSQLSKVSQEFGDIIIQNTWQKIIFKFGASEGAETASALFGKHLKYQKSISLTGNESVGSQVLRTRPDSSESEGGGMSIAYREEEDYRFSPDKIMALGMGEVFALSGSRAYHLRTPMINFPDEVLPCEIARHKVDLPDDKEPLHFEKRLNEFLMVS